MKKLLIAAMLMAAPSLAYAKAYGIPDKDPVATVVLPEDWDADEIDNGVEVSSADDEVYLAIEHVKASDMKSAIGETIDYLTSKGVKLDSSSMKQQDATTNGMPGTELDWTGKDKDGDTVISLILVQPTKTDLVMVTFWGTPKGLQANIEALKKISASLKPAN